MMLQLAFYKWYDRTAAAAAMYGRRPTAAVIACRHMEAMVKQHAQASLLPPVVHVDSAAAQWRGVRRPPPTT